MIRKLKEYFGHLKGNSAVCVAFHPVWSVPYSFYTFYISLYLLEKGISSGQLGQLQVIGTVAATLFSFLSAPIVDRMGRKRSTLVFDLLSSALPPLVYLFTESFPLAVVAIILFNANRIMSVGYYLTMTEDADDDGKVVAFNLWNIITVVAGLLIPLGGLAVDRFGLVEAERAFLWGSFILMTAMILIRDRLLKETDIGQRVRERVRSERFSLKSLWQPYGDAFRFLAHNKAARCIALANVFFCVYMNLGTNYSLYFVPYFSDRMQMNTIQASVLGSVYYGGMLAAMIFINPSSGKDGLLKKILQSGVLTLVGFALMIFVPGGNFPLAILAVLVLALGYGMLKSNAEGALAVYSESEYRSGIYSAANLLSSGVGVAVTALCSVLYGRFAGWLYILCGAMVLVMMGFVAAMLRPAAQDAPAEPKE